MICFLGHEPHWTHLLDQEGVSYVTDAAGQIDQAKVLILDRLPESSELPSVRRYVDHGGSVLAWAGNALGVWPDLRFRKEQLNYLLPDGSALFRNVGLVDVATTGFVPAVANTGTTPGGRPAVFCGMLGASPVVLLPFDLTGVLATRKSGPLLFPTSTCRQPFETVSVINRGEVRRLVANCLKYLLHKQGLPYVRLSYVPEGASCFGMRIDTDESSAEAFREAAGIARAQSMRFTWFVHVEAADKELPPLVADTLVGQDIQLHCYQHRMYPDYRRNRDDLEKGIARLRNAGVSPTGVAAPFGLWNEKWNQAVSDLGLGYSSEFAVGYDDLPFRPLVSGEPSRVLQVPVHPICFGRLAAARMKPEEMFGYFMTVIRRQVARLEPCFLYGHPEAVTRFQDEFRQVVEFGQNRCGSTLAMTDYARWWCAREETGYSVSVEPGSMLVSNVTAQEFGLVVESDEAWASTPLVDGQVKYEELEWQPLESIKYEIEELKRSRRSGLRLRFGEIARAWRRARA